MPPTHETAARAAARGAALRRVLGLFAVLALVAVTVAAVLSGLSTTAALDLLGIPDPGVLTTAGLPAVRALAELSVAVAIGAALFAAFLTPPQRNALLDVDGYRAQQLSAWANTAWAAAAAFLIPLTLSDVSGSHLTEALPPQQWFVAVAQIDVASSWRWAALLAIVAAIGQRATLSWRWSVIWLVVTGLSLVPVAATGHSSTGGAHDIATNSLLIHLIAATVYVGTMIALIVHVLRGGGRVALALRRFSGIATVAIIALGITGLINVLVRMRLTDLLSSTYGLLVLGKFAAILAVGLLGLVVRRKIIDRIDAGNPAGSVNTPLLLRIIITEAVILSATIALSVSLGRTPPPEPAIQPTPLEVQLGFQLNEQLTLANLFTIWRIDLVVGAGAVIALGLYLWGWFALRRRGDAWPMHRFVFWALGCLVLFVTTSSHLGMQMMAVFSWHMVGHMLLSMLAPVLLALGGPMTLALRALRPAGRGNPPGPREWLLEFIHNPLSRVITHPIVAAIQFVAGFYLIYYAGFYDWLVSEHMGHMMMNIHFVISGYIFYWSIIGVDPAPRQFSPLYKLLVLLSSLPFHAFFGILLMFTDSVLGETWYSSLDLPYIPDLLADQYTGGAIAWGIGEIPLFIVMIALGIQWWQSDERESRRTDRQADRDDDAELRAYNEMLSQMSGRGGSDAGQGAGDGVDGGESAANSTGRTKPQE